MVRGVYSTGKRPGRVQVDAQRQPSVRNLGPGGVTFWLENLPLATGPFGGSSYLSIRSSPLTSFREECTRAGTPDAVTLGEFLLPECYKLDARIPLEIGITNFSRRPNDWDKAVIAPPPNDDWDKAAIATPPRRYLGGSREQGASPTDALVPVHLADLSVFVPLSPRSRPKLRSR